jgi:hypothetical protein
LSRIRLSWLMSAPRLYFLFGSSLPQKNPAEAER